MNPSNRLQATPAGRLSQSGALAALLLGSLLRFYRLGAQSFWNDEGNSARLAERPIRLILEGAAGDIHPPGYYLALAGWRALTGESEYALRALSALAGIALVALVYRLGRHYFDRPAALAAALAAAVWPPLVYYSQEARMYSLAATLAAAAFLLMSRWLMAYRVRLTAGGTPHAALDDPLPDTGNMRSAARHLQAAVGYVLVASAGLYTHYAFAFVLTAANLAALGGMAFHRRQLFRARAKLWVTLQLAALALFAPWLPTAVRQVATWPSERSFLPFGQAVGGLARWMLAGPGLDAAGAWVGLVGLAVLLVLALRRGGQTITPLIWLAAPASLAAFLGLYSEAFVKVLIVAVPALCLLAGHGAATLVAPRARGGRIRGATLPQPTGRAAQRLVSLAAALGLGLAAVMVVGSLRNLYFEAAYARDDYRGIARMVEAGARPGDGVVLNAANQWEVFTYYHRSGAPVYPIPRARPPDPATTVAELEQIAARHDRLFVLWWGEAQADPERLVETWLAANAFKALESWHGDVRVSTYGVSQAAPQATAAVDARFGDSIRLDRIAIADETLAPGDIVQLTLYWQYVAEADLDSSLPSYQVFVHLAGPDRLPLAQHDGEPVAGLRPTDSWQPGERLADNHGVQLPTDLPAGRYGLLVGLYAAVDGARLPVNAGGRAVGDSLPLGDIQVGP